MTGSFLTKNDPPFIVIGRIGLVTALGIGFVAFRSANTHSEIMLGALQRGLEHVYDQSVGGTPLPVSLPTSTLRNLLLDTKIETCNLTVVRQLARRFLAS